MSRSMKALMLAGLLLAGASQAQTVEYIHTDALGSVVAVTNAQRKVVERREYEPYGHQLTPAVTNGPGYTGHVQDAATGLVYMQQRYYDPVVGRFLSTDPDPVKTDTAWNFNRYAYAANNPYTFVDPDGREIAFSFRNGATARDGARTMAYLMKSPTARRELAQLQGSRHTYRLSFDRGRNAQMSYDSDTRKVTINPTSGLRVGDAGDIQSPAIGAAHEISHAAQHDRIGTDAFNASLDAPVLSVDMTEDGGMRVTYGTSPEEQRATAVESNVARELGEPTRSSYTNEKGSVRTCGPTSRSEC